MEKDRAFTRMGWIRQENNKLKCIQNVTFLNEQSSKKNLKIMLILFYDHFRCENIKNSNNLNFFL